MSKVLWRLRRTICLSENVTKGRRLGTEDLVIALNLGTKIFAAFVTRKRGVALALAIAKFGNSGKSSNARAAWLKCNQDERLQPRANAKQRPKRGSFRFQSSASQVRNEPWHAGKTVNNFLFRGTVFGANYWFGEAKSTGPSTGIETFGPGRQDTVLRGLTPLNGAAPCERSINPAWRERLSHLCHCFAFSFSPLRSSATKVSQFGNRTPEEMGLQLRSSRQ